MQFHSYATHGKPYVVKALTAYTPIGIFHKGMGELTNIITPRIHPHIHITWHSCRWVGVHHRVALPFQDTTAISRIPHTIIYGHCSLVQDLIAHLDSLAHPKPFHQQVKPRGYALRQSLNAVKDYANKRLSLGEIIKSIPVKALQHRTIKEFLALIKPQRELDETKVYPVIHHSYAKSHVSLMHKDVPKKQRIADNVPTPHAFRLLQQSVQPFQSMPLPPHGRTLHRTGEEVKHRPDSAHMAVYIKFIPMGI